MADLWQTVKDQLSALAGNWASYTALGSFTLYVLGYLSLRFHLTALGIGTDLAVLDERYLFTGARFFVYLVSTVPTVILLLILLAATCYLPSHPVAPKCPHANCERRGRALGAPCLRLARKVVGMPRHCTIGAVDTAHHVPVLLFGQPAGR